MTRKRERLPTSATPDLDRWFAAQGRTPFPFQRTAWAAYADGASGLIHAPTGTGKTLAALLGPMQEALHEAMEEARENPPSKTVSPVHGSAESEPPRLLWLTPLRALARDTVGAISAAAAALNLPWSVELRTGDVSSSVKARQRKRLPTVLVTTPESLCLLLSHADTAARFASLRAVVVDEWHELLGSKRGVQVELGLARLRHLAAGLRTWGLSATIGNLEQALAVLVPGGGRLIAAGTTKKITVSVALPPPERVLPLAGHLGLAQLPQVLTAVDGARTTLLFTNMRSQAEMWFSAIHGARPDWPMALHHGALERALRDAAEDGARTGTLKLVVCTSSLDLGVDFAPVDLVIQIGSPKGIARLAQRAGRSGHQPNGVARLVGVPTHALELLEFVAARRALAAGRIEARTPLRAPLDVLTQHVVTLALGGGFVADELLAEVRSTFAYRDLTEQEWCWCLDFVVSGGPTLTRYPRFQRVQVVDGRHVVTVPEIARLHRLAIGTIVSDQAVSVRLVRGGNLGTVEESFITRLLPQQVFRFAGRALELVRFHDGVAEVRVSKRPANSTPQWMGGTYPLSSFLADEVLALFGELHAGREPDPDLRAIAAMVRAQRERSHLPRPGVLLAERITLGGRSTGDGGHLLCLYPFAGRLAHEGLGALLSWRLTRYQPLSVSVMVNDYGLTLAAPTPLLLDASALRALLSPTGLVDDLLASMNAGELARRRFREVARIAGLLIPDLPGKGRGARQVQASANLFFDVFRAHDPGHLLLAQAEREVLERELEVTRLRTALERLDGWTIDLVDSPRLTPLSFPLWTEFIQSQFSSEPWDARVRRMQAEVLA